MEKKIIKNSGRKMVSRKTPTCKSKISPRTRRNTTKTSSAVMNCSMKVHNPVKNDVSRSCEPSTSRGSRISDKTLEQEIKHLEEKYDKCAKYLSSYYKKQEMKHLDEMFNKFTKHLSPKEILRNQAAQVPRYYQKPVVVPDPTIQHRTKRISLMTSKDRVARQNAPKQISQKGTEQPISSPSPSPKKKIIKNSGRKMVSRKTPTCKSKISPRTRQNTTKTSSAVMTSSIKVHNLGKNDVSSSGEPSTSRGSRISEKILEQDIKHLEEAYDNWAKYLSAVDCILKNQAIPRYYKKQVVVPNPTIQHRTKRISLMTSKDRAARQNAPKLISQKGKKQPISSPSRSSKPKKRIKKKPTVEKQTSEKAPETQPNPLPEELLKEGVMIINIFKRSHRKVVDGPKRTRFIRKEARERAERRYAGSRLPGEIISSDSEGSEVSG